MIEGIEPNSPTWRAIHDHVTAEIEKARVRIETPGMASVETENLRGAIAALRRLIAQDHPKPNFARSVGYAE